MDMNCILPLRFGSLFEVGMFNYMTPLDKVDIVRSVDVQATGHDMLDLRFGLDRKDKRFVFFAG